MPRIEWDESYSVNHHAIDEQHKKWIGIYNRLGSVLDAGDAAPQQEVTAEILQSMLDYARHHFRFEEEYMRAIGYPARASHSRMHRECDALVYQVYMELLDGKAVLDSELLQMIKGWLLNHILVEDRKYSLFASRAEAGKEEA